MRLRIPHQWISIPFLLYSASFHVCADSKLESTTELNDLVLEEVVLHPTFGRALMPRSWHYSEGHRKNSLMWTLSKEKVTQDSGYETGQRIQAFLGVRKSTGKSPREFILKQMDIWETKPGIKVVKSCPITDSGDFERKCLEVIDGDYQILYSCFWGKQMDMAAVIIAGAPKDIFVDYEVIFNSMTDVSILGSEFWENIKSDKKTSKSRRNQ